MLDTARFKYPPHWVDIELLYEAIKSIDKETQKPRGFIVISKKLTRSGKR
jgi:glutathione gamma-glutamylcysteinyltransferase